jgi:hypothetical protein
MPDLVRAENVDKVNGAIGIATKANTVYTKKAHVHEDFVWRTVGLLLHILDVVGVLSDVDNTGSLLPE